MQQTMNNELELMTIHFNNTVLIPKKKKIFTKMIKNILHVIFHIMVVVNKHDSEYLTITYLY